MTRSTSQESEQVQRREQRRQAASQEAKEAAAQRNQPDDITERTRSQRQAKHVHQQDGKK